MSWTFDSPSVSSTTTFERAAIDDAIAAGVKVYTIGAGTTGLAPIRVDVGDGQTRLMQTEVSIDENLLREIAERTGGRYFRATDHQALAGVYAQIDRLERSRIEQVRFTEYRQFYGWFVGAAMALVAVALALRGTLLRRLP